MTKKCEASCLYGKDEFKNITFYCEFCNEEMDYEEDRECKIEREKCKNCNNDLGKMDFSVNCCLNCNKDLD